MRSALAARRTWIAASRALATTGSGEAMGDAENEDAELDGGDGVDRDDDSSGWYESAGDDVPLALRVLMVSMVLMVLMMILTT